MVAVAAILPRIPCCPTVSKAPAIHGCIRAVGPLGTKPVRPAPPPHCQGWGSRCQSTTIWARSTMSRFKRSAARPWSVSEVRRKKHEVLKAASATVPCIAKVAKLAMTRGSKPGERRGGRQCGTPNKATLAKAAALRGLLLTFEFALHELSKRRNKQR